MPIYMKIEGITGQATESNHSEWIECLSLSSPLARQVPDGLYGTDAVTKGALVFGNIELARKVDASSVPLAKQTALGKVYDTIDIHVTTPLGGGGEVNVLEYKLSKGILASHSIHVLAPTANNQDLGENVSINFAKIEWTYRKYKDGQPDGQVPGNYDRRTAQGG